MSDALRGLIHDAFLGTRPPRRPVTGHRCPECDEVDALLGGRTWADVAADFPPLCSGVFPLLTEDARAYYLPAYMLAALESGSLQGVSLEAAVQDDWLQPRWFTPSQRAAVGEWAAAYWRISEGDEPPQSVIERWRQAKV